MNDTNSAKIILSLGTAICIVIGSSVCVNGTQIIEEIDSGNLFYNPSIVINNNNEPTICYEDIAGSLIFISKTENGWDKTVIDNMGGKPFRTSLDVDNKRNPHISYTVQDIGLKYAIRSGINWTTIVIEHGNLGGSSLVLDSDGYPHICYIDWTNSSLKYTKWTGSSWQIETVESFDNDTDIWYTHLEIDTEDNPHIIYSYKVGGPEEDCNIRYAYWNNTDWNIETIASSSNDDPVSFCLDSNNRPNLILWIGSFRYAVKSNEGWQIESVPSAISYTPVDSLAINSKGKPIFCYFDSENKTIKSAIKIEGDWQITDIYESHDNSLGEYVNLYHSLDLSDNHYILLEDLVYFNLIYLYVSSSDHNFPVLHITAIVLITIAIISTFIMYRYHKR